MARTWTREPLVHFLLAGAAIFIVTTLWPGGGDARTITIDQQQLVDYMLARAQLTDREQFDAVYRAMSPEQRATLIRRVAQDEALYREGLAIGLDKVDPLVRQRIIQQTRQLLGDEAAAGIELSDAELEAFYQAHRDDYRQGDTLGFTHVYFAAGGDAQAAQRRARAELERLRAGRATPAVGATRGERFLYETHFSEANRDDVTAKFGADFTTALFALPIGQWQGPLRSDHGWHLVLVTGHAEGRLPGAQELGLRLRADALAARQEQIAGTALERVLGDYRIVTSADLPE